MPLEYEIDQEGIVRTRGLGAVSVGELERHVRSLAADPVRPTPMRELFDGRDLTSISLFTRDIRGVFDLAATFHSQFGKARLAILAGPSVLYGLGRVAEVFAQATPFTVGVFRELEAAERFLREPG